MIERGLSLIIKLMFKRITKFMRAKASSGRDSHLLSPGGGAGRKVI